MNIILAGEKGAGKTTACLRLAALLEEHHIPFGGIICADGRIKDLTGGSRKFYDSAGTAGTLSVGRYHIRRSALAFGSRAIENACNGARVILIDEFGRLEFNREGYYSAVTKALATGRCLIVVRKSMLAPFKLLFPEYCFEIFNLSAANRDSIPRDIFYKALFPKKKDVRK